MVTLAPFGWYANDPEASEWKALTELTVNKATVAGETLTTYQTPYDADLLVITAGPDGTLWSTSGFVNLTGRVIAAAARQPLMLSLPVSRCPV